MFNISDLRSIIMLNYLTDPMLKKIESITSMTEFKAGEYIFKEGEYAKHLFSVIEGEVGLETEKNASTKIVFTEIRKGQTIGFSSLLDTEHRKYLGHAKALTDVKVFKWKGSELEELFVDDYELGFLIMRRLANIIDRRFQIMKAQFVGMY